MKQTKHKANRFGFLKHGIKAALVLFMLLACKQANAQIVFQQTRILAESSTHMDVSATVRRCDTTNYVHLRVFNESKDTQDAVFTINIISDAAGKSKSKNVSIKNMLPVTVKEGTCTSGPADLIIDLPKDYDPRLIRMEVIF